MPCRALYAHTSEAIDFEALKGKRIGILGGGASAFDNANWALEQGVGEVHVFMRRKQMPRINPIRFMEKVGWPRAIRRCRTLRSIAPWRLSCRTISRLRTIPSIARQVGRACPASGSPWEASPTKTARWS
jgi:cation diffusion facilitator CzcD-associated flavoprotein CzcO